MSEFLENYEDWLASRSRYLSCRFGLPACDCRTLLERFLLQYESQKTAWLAAKRVLIQQKPKPGLTPSETESITQPDPALLEDVDFLDFIEVRLNDRERRAVILFLQGYTREEIAEEFAICCRHSNRILFKAIQKLREEYFEC